jgi:hypothetical protein
MFKNASTLTKNPVFLLCAGALCGGLIVFVVSHSHAGSPGAASAGEQRQDAEHTAVPVAASFSGSPQQNIPPPMQTAIPTAPDLQWPGRDIERWQSTSGYPIVVGRRAVDSGDAVPAPTIEPSSGAPGMVAQTVPAYQGQPATTFQTVTVYQSAAPDYGDSDYYRRLDSRGMVGNPPVDPISSHGAAYSRSY